MTVVLLAAGTSSRMGKVNKLLLPVDGRPMVAHCCLNALKYLSSSNNAHIVVVTGYQSLRTKCALKECKVYAKEHSIEMTVVKNGQFKSGQFSSVKTGVEKVANGEDFFICLSDLALVTERNYRALDSCLSGFDAVRPFVNDIPGHPVLLGSVMKQKILKSPDGSSVRELLKGVKVKELSFSDSSWITDKDTL